MSAIIRYRKRLPILECDYYVVLYNDWNLLLNKFDELNKSNSLNGCLFFVKDMPHIAIKTNARNINGVVAHECKHFLNYIFSYYGVKLDCDNDEIECYFLSHIVNEVYKCINK